MYDDVVFVWHCMPLVCIPKYCVVFRCNDIHLAKAYQYAVLSLVGPSSLFRIVSHIGRDKLVSELRPTLGAPLIVRSWPLLSLEANYFGV